MSWSFLQDEFPFCKKIIICQQCEKGVIWWDKILFFILILLMSTQQDAYLSIPSGYNFNKDSLSQYRRNSINPSDFQAWFKNDMYCSSYAKHHSPVIQFWYQDSIEPRSAHIPGYGGFIPKDRAESLYAKTFSNKTKDVLADPNINMNRSGLATTGFNIAK